MCVDPFERIWANILCKLTILFDLPALGNSTGRGEMSPKHQHWNSFSGKALEWIFLCKELGSSASLMSRDRSQCNWVQHEKPLCWFLAALLTFSTENWQVCSSFSNDAPAPGGAAAQPAFVLHLCCLLSEEGAGREHKWLLQTAELPSSSVFHLFQGVYSNTTSVPCLTMFM